MVNIYKTCQVVCRYIILKSLILSFSYGFRPKWATVLGAKYKVGATLHIGQDDDGFPTFWEIKKIYIINNDVRKIIFIVSEMETILFNKHFHSYEVIHPAQSNCRIAYARDFTCHVPFNQVTQTGLRTRSRFVCVRYDIET